MTPKAPRRATPYREMQPWSNLWQERMTETSMGVTMRRIGHTPQGDLVDALSWSYYNQQATQHRGTKGFRRDGASRNAAAVTNVTDFLVLEGKFRPEERGCALGIDGAGALVFFPLTGGCRTELGWRQIASTVPRHPERLPYPTGALNNVKKAMVAEFESSGGELVGGPLANMNLPFAFATSDERRVYICDSEGQRLLLLDRATGAVSVVSSNAIPHGEAGHSHFHGPRGVALFEDGAIWIGAPTGASTTTVPWPRHPAIVTTT